MNNRKAFTIVELLTSIVIIAILLGILLPSIATVRRMAKETAQKAQFATMDMAMDAFKQDYGDYPPSYWRDISLPMPLGVSYCGAQKLAEALVGWDLMGFHPQSAWRSDGYSGTAIPGGDDSYDPDRVRGNATLFERKGPYLEAATANVFRLGDLFNSTSPLAANTFVLCDVFRVRKITDSAGKTVTAGAPILYYKAITANKTIDINVPINSRIYNYNDNRPLVDLQKLTANGVAGLKHPLGYGAGGDFPVFYNDKFPYPPPSGYGGSGIGYGIRDPKITQNVWPYRPDSYILISAGYDGFYGTADDIYNY